MVAAPTTDATTAPKQKFACGIDLGTTNSICYVRFPGTAQPSPVSTTTEKFTPSVVSFENNRTTVGIPALNMIASGKPGLQYIAMSKLLMGLVSKDISAEERRAFATLFTCQLDYSMDESAPRFIIKNKDNTERKVRPEEVAAMILKKIHADVRSVANLPENTIIETTLTVPARFGTKAKQATHDAAKMAGFEVIRLVTEPIAATLCAVQQGYISCPKENEDPKFIMVFDCGGGTTDVVLVNLCEQNVVEMVLPDGDAMLGGRNVTMAIRDRIMDAFCADYGVDRNEILKDSRAMSKLWIEAEEAKKRIQAKDPLGHEIEIYNFFQGHNLEFQYRYKQFVEDFKPLKDRLMKIFYSLLEQAEKKPSDLDNVIFVGGSCRIRELQEEIEKIVGVRKVISSVDFDNAIAHGACFVSELVRGHGLAEGEKKEDVVLLDVSPSSYRIEVKGEMAPAMIKRGSTFPITETMSFTTAHPDQTTVEIVVLEGENEVARYNNKIGSFILTGIERPQGKIPDIKVTFKLDVDGLLHVTAVDAHTGKSNEIKINSSTMTEEERNKFVESQKAIEEEAKKVKELLVIKNEIENMVDDITKTCETGNKEVPTIVSDLKKNISTMNSYNILERTSIEKLQEQKATLTSDPSVQQIIQEMQASGMGSGAQAYGPNAAAAAAAAAAASNPTVDEAD